MSTKLGEFHPRTVGGTDYVYSTSWYETDQEKPAWHGKMLFSALHTGWDDTFVLSSGPHMGDSSLLTTVGLHKLVGNTYLGNPSAPPPYFSPPWMVQTTTYEPSSASQGLAMATYVQSDYDSEFGLIAEKKEYLSSSEFVAQTPSRRTKYESDCINTDRWIVQLTSAKEVLDEAGAVRERVEYFYDGNAGIQDTPTEGRMTKTVTYADPGTAEEYSLEQNFSYTSAGNLFKSWDSVRETEVVWSNGLSHKFEEILPYRVYQARAGGGTVVDHFREYSFDDWGRTEWTEDPNGTRQYFEFDNLGRLKKKYSQNLSDTGLSPPETHYAYTMEQGVGAGTSQRVVLETTTKFNATTDIVSERIVDGLGRVLLERQVDGTDFITQSTVYDGLGSPQTTTSPYVVDTIVGDAEYQTDVRGPVHEYDALGREIRVTTSGGYVATRAYELYEDPSTLDVLSMEVGSATKAAGTQLHYHFKDAWGRSVRITECPTTSCSDPDAAGVYTTKYSYDFRGNLTEVQMSDGLSKTVYFYDGLGRRIGVKDPDMSNCADSDLYSLSSGCAWTTEYDDLGRVDTSTDARGDSTTIVEYDKLDRVLEKTSEGEDGTATYTYTYDVTAYPGVGLDFPIGRLTEATVSTAHLGGGTTVVTERYRHNSLGQVIEREQTVTLSSGESYTTTHLVSYNHGGVPESSTGTYDTETETVTTAFDNLGRVTQVTSSTIGTVVDNVVWRPDGRVAEYRLGGSLVSERGYRDGDYTLPEGDGRLESLVTKYGLTEILRLEYDYDGLGNILEMDDSLRGLHEYTYDLFDRLVQFDRDGRTRETYAYDRLGNRTEWAFYSYEDDPGDPGDPESGFAGGESSGGGTAPTIGIGSPVGVGVGAPTGGGGAAAASGPTIDYRYAVFGAPYDGSVGGGTHALVCIGEGAADPCNGPKHLQKLTYDANGNLVERKYNGGNTLDIEYTHHNKIWKLNGGTGQVEYVYGPAGDKVAIIDGLTLTVFASPGLEVEVDLTPGSSDESVTRRWAFGPGVVAQREGTDAVEYAILDHLGSVRALVNASGTVEKRMAFKPFGQVTDQVGSESERYRFNGNATDSYGIIDYGARSYWPGLGVFLQADSVVPNYANPQTLNRYAYALNNPIKYIDPTGHEAEEGGVWCDPMSLVMNCAEMGVNLNDRDHSGGGSNNGGSGGDTGGSESREVVEGKPLEVESDGTVSQGETEDPNGNSPDASSSGGNGGSGADDGAAAQHATQMGEVKLSFSEDSETFTVKIQTEIVDDGSADPGVKSVQTIVVNKLTGEVKKEVHVESTFGVFPSLKDNFDSVVTVGDDGSIRIAVEGFTKTFFSMGRDDAISYRYQIDYVPGVGAQLSGGHDPYPTHSVYFNGSPVYSRFQNPTHGAPGVNFPPGVPWLGHPWSNSIGVLRFVPVN